MIAFKEYLQLNETNADLRSHINVEDIKFLSESKKHGLHTKEYSCTIKGHTCVVRISRALEDNKYHKEGKRFVEVYNKSSGIRFSPHHLPEDKIGDIIEEWEFDQKLPSYTGLSNVFGEYNESVTKGPPHYDPNEWNNIKYEVVGQEWHNSNTNVITKEKPSTEKSTPVYRVKDSFEGEWMVDPPNVNNKCLSFQPNWLRKVRKYATEQPGIDREAEEVFNASEELLRNVQNNIFPRLIVNYINTHKAKKYMSKNVFDQMKDIIQGGNVF